MPKLIQEESFKSLFSDACVPEVYEDLYVRGSVVAVNDKYVIIDAGLKSEGVIPLEEFAFDDVSVNLNIGDEVDVVVENPDGYFQGPIFSRKKATAIIARNKLQEVFENDEVIEGIIQTKVRGGLLLEIMGLRAFLPTSLFGGRIEEFSSIVGTKISVKIISCSSSANNIIVSRKKAIEVSLQEEYKRFEELAKTHEPVEGIVRNIQHYGAFIAVGMMDGLLHITDIAYRRIGHPSEIFEVGQKIQVCILGFNRENGRLSLGMKQLKLNPWDEVISKSFCCK